MDCTSRSTYPVLIVSLNVQPLMHPKHPTSNKGRKMQSTEELATAVDGWVKELGDLHAHYSRTFWRRGEGAIWVSPVFYVTTARMIGNVQLFPLSDLW
jgi:hypothetical protein